MLIPLTPAQKLEILATRKALVAESAVPNLLKALWCNADGSFIEPKFYDPEAGGFHRRVESLGLK